MPISSFRDIWLVLIELTMTLPIVYAIALVASSIAFWNKAEKWSPLRTGMWTGAIVSGSLPFLLAAFSMVHYISRHDASILSDPEFWWSTWFGAVFVTALPALLIGGCLGALLGWIFGKR